MLGPRCFRTFTHQLSLSSTVLGQSSRQHLMFTQVHAGRPILACPCVRVQERILLHPYSSLILQQYFTCLVRLTWMVWDWLLVHKSWLVCNLLLPTNPTIKWPCVKSAKWEVRQISRCQQFTEKKKSNKKKYTSHFICAFQLSSKSREIWSDIFFWVDEREPYYSINYSWTLTDIFH